MPFREWEGRVLTQSNGRSFNEMTSRKINFHLHM